MQTPDAFREAMLAQIPVLKAFALRLVKSRTEADDLVQETLMRALRYRDTFEDGTSMKSWLCRILQNCFYKDASRRRDTIQDVEGRCAAQQMVAAPQEWSVLYAEMLAAIDRLAPETRDAFLMVVAHGASYEEAAQAFDCPIGTLKSRVSRARDRLMALTDDVQALSA
ncbi:MULTISPECIES: sigma-70 family RNA polymerase sigma factor [Asticcacaulis]|uniref:sigma-70 family RNA polymerase sigma factor n=1 Tax=Asticcacaulis TaxID=76890 RepID=UPI001AE7603A|nr:MULTISPECIES: sigma-70 family RNA polymerase sigma factor [Asticcacaulis]MBP2157853.1 RNA polymerase sigma-70 factor (ECF subfamily) [Asticcacaulis solisilvae]MDR6798898.1 RNA polymerase sigma-70 factor (ECF subfamily) [Asticcacaulis sp. BE141]